MPPQIIRMLTRLHIRNFAIIESLNIEFDQHLNVITGETGAGKSILMGALGLILGDRADSSVLPDDGSKCIVEGFFTRDEDEKVRRFLAENDLDDDGIVVMRREILASGKSRSFINDTPVNLTQMRQLGSLLVDLHRQFDTQDLIDVEFQRAVLDALAGNENEIRDLKEVFSDWQKVKLELNALQQEQERAQKEQDYHRFLYEELESLDLKAQELEELESELKLLENAEKVKSELSGLYMLLKEDDDPIVARLKTIQQKLSLLNDFIPDAGELQQRLSSTLIELDDIADEISRQEGMIRFGGERLQVVQDRLAEGYRLMKKHNVQDTAGLINMQLQLEQMLQTLESNHQKIAELASRAAALEADITVRAKRISKRRKEQVKPLEEKVNALLLQVGMPNARLMVRLEDIPVEAHGSDRVSLMFNANIAGEDALKTERFSALEKVASGGERSRLMLSIKSVVARKLQLPTLIFDEIDSGISGEAARQVGIILKSLAADHQIIAITHQPQVAAKADAHYFVYKEMKAKKILTGVRSLNREERIEAVARMLGGEKPTAAAMQNAREMVELSE